MNNLNNDFDYIEVKNLSKSFGNTKALDDFNANFKKNAINGLMGRNSAGKTTFLDIFANRKYANNGEIFYNGKSVYENDDVLEKLFYSTEKIIGLNETKLKKIIERILRIRKDFDIEYCKKLIDIFGVDVNKRFNTLSSGYKTIFLDILNLSSNAEIMLFDEPVSGMDVNHRELFYKLLLEKYEELNNTIILSTHLIEEVSPILEYIVIVHEGRKMYECEADKIINNTYVIRGEEEKLKAIKDKFNVISFEKNKLYVINTKNENFDNIEINKSHYKIENVSLQETFMQIIKKGENYDL